MDKGGPKPSDRCPSKRKKGHPGTEEQPRGHGASSQSRSPSLGSCLRLFYGECRPLTESGTREPDGQKAEQTALCTCRGHSRSPCREGLSPARQEQKEARAALGSRIPEERP